MQVRPLKLCRYFKQLPIHLNILRYMLETAKLYEIQNGLPKGRPLLVWLQVITSPHLNAAVVASPVGFAEAIAGGSTDAIAATVIGASGVFRAAAVVASPAGVACANAGMIVTEAVAHAVMGAGNPDPGIAGIAVPAFIAVAYAGHIITGAMGVAARRAGNPYKNAAVVAIPAGIAGA